MIVVRVELWSAVTGEKKTIGLMRISNDGRRTGPLFDYDGEIAHKTRLDWSRVSRRGRVEGWAADAKVVWRLVLAMLKKCYPEDV